MKKTTLLILALAVSFGFGFAFKAILNNPSKTPLSMKKVTGIGGIFFKCQDPKKVRAWYQTHLGLNTNPYGVVFEWRQAEDSTKKGFSQWSPFAGNFGGFDHVISV